LDIVRVAKASVQEVKKCVFPNREFDVKLSTNPTDMQTICDSSNAVPDLSKLILYSNRDLMAVPDIQRDAPNVVSKWVEFLHCTS
jgi:hypothetical protein